jgi:hypothetical protein
MPVKRIIKPGLSEILFWGLTGSVGMMHNSLFPIEAALVEKLFGMVDRSLSLRLQKQFGCYNHFDRGGEWREFGMRRKTWGKVNFPSELKIQTEKTDVRIASFKFNTNGRQTPNWAVFHLVRGRLFCVEFGTSYKSIRFENEINVQEFRLNRELAEMVKNASSGSGGPCQ